MSKSKIVITLLLISLASCIPSLHGIVSSNHIILDDHMIGEWVIDSQNANMLPSVQITGSIETGDSSLNDSSLEMWTFERAKQLKWRDRQGEHHRMISSLSFVPTHGQIIEELDLPYYVLTHQEIEHSDTLKTILLVHLTQIGQHIFMDFMPHSDMVNMTSRFYANMIPAHSFAKLHLDSDQMEISPVDGEYIEQLMKQKKIRLKHELIHGEDIVLTASTQDLRAFFAKYGDHDQLYDNMTYLSKKDH